jgi:hypothetical protein
MKVIYTRAIKTLSGKMGKFVHTNKLVGEKAVVRKYVKPRLTENNQNIGNIMKNVSAVWKTCSDGFKNDLKTYTLKSKEYSSGDEIPAVTNFANFIKLLYRFRETNPNVDLVGGTKDELEEAGIPTNVADVVNQGLLEPIPDSEDLTENW